ncbi:hypothetical protein QUF80_05755 [Desulfococcaceae bacterium HSG8]|nr:hypothetical protein [Desulfococcaceae bacterium HSG8]
MAKDKDLEKDVLIKRSEEFVWQLLRDIDHSVFHKERRIRARRHTTVNAALIKIFAFRHTYENFEMLKAAIVQIAEETASPETKEELKRLESENDRVADANASKLIKTILFLLGEETEKCLEEKEKRKEADNKWAIIIQVAEKIASAEAGENPEVSEDDIPKLIKIILFLLREEIDRYYLRKSREEAEPDNTRKMEEKIIRSFGNTREKEQPVTAEPLAVGEPAANPEKKAMAEVLPYTPKKKDTEISPGDTDLDYLVANLGVKELDELISPRSTKSEEPEKESEEEPEIRVIKKVISGDSDDLAANLGDIRLDELMFPKKKTEDEDDNGGDDKEKKDGWMGWID